MLTELDRLPDRYCRRGVERADALFDSIQNGPTLRAVFDPDDEEGMLLHAFEVARDRRRI